MKHHNKMAVLILAILCAIAIIVLIGCNSDEKETQQIIFETRGGNAIETKKVETNTFITLPTPVRENAIFIGWYASTTWEQKVEEKLIVNTSMVLFARWAIYQEIELNSENYKDYINISVDYVDTINRAPDFPQGLIEDYYRITCTAKENIFKDGKESDTAPSGVLKSSICFSVRGYTKLSGGIGETEWRDQMGYRFGWYSSSSEMEKQNGMRIFDISGTLRVYILDN